MEILALKATCTDDDINFVVTQVLPRELPVEDVRVTVLAEGIRVQGMYPLFVNVHFETLWEIGVLEGRLAARMTQFKALGIPASIFKSAILKLLEDVVRRESTLQMKEDTLLVDVDALLAKQGLQAHTNLRSVVCQPGLLQVECGHVG